MTAAASYVTLSALPSRFLLTYRTLKLRACDDGCALKLAPRASKLASASCNTAEDGFISFIIDISLESGA